MGRIYRVIALPKCVLIALKNVYISRIICIRSKLCVVTKKYDSEIEGKGVNERVYNKP